jgi:hypothetical protein
MPAKRLLLTIRFSSSLLALSIIVLPLIGWPQNPSYVGSKVCAACHADIFATYTKTAMGHSMVRGDNPALLSHLPSPFTVFDSETGEYFEVSQKDGAIYQSQYAVDREGKEIFRQSWKLPFVVGSGENGFGFLLERGGYLFEAPLTYYTKSHVWGFSPGYELRNLAFTRPVVAECVGCHSGRPQPIYGRTALYRNPPFAELAVGCENCHGPGGRHVAERRAGHAVTGHADTGIVNPAHLSGWLSDNICMKCHQGGDVRVEQPGKHEQDFRPGTPLDDVVAIFKAPLSREASSQSVLLEHYFSMTLSKCYRASAGGLRCTSCHDPHTQPQTTEAGAFYRAKCLSCHTPASCKLPIADRQKTSAADECSSCHMPKRTVTTITHAALTDHRIVTRPDEPYPPEAFDPGESSGGLLHLTAEPRGQTGNIPAITLFQAYAGLIHEGHSEFKAKANVLLDRLARQSPSDPVVLSALARRAMNAGKPEAVDEAIRDFTKAIQAGAAAEDYLLLAGLYGKRKQNAEAISVLRKGMRDNPFVREFSESLAVQYMALGQYRDASAVIREGLDLFPDDVTLRVLQKKVGSATLDGSMTP